MFTAPASFGRSQRKTKSSHLHRRLLAVALVVTLASATATTVGASTAFAAPSGCSDVLAVMTPGTWETRANADPAVPIGMLATIGNDLKAKYGNKIELFYTNYAASAFDQGMTYGDSKATGLTVNNDKLKTVASRCPQTKFILSGYSQGADIVGDIASAIGNGRGPIPANKVLAVGLLADPGQGTDGESVVGPRVTGQGIADPRPQGMGTLKGRVATICDPKDLYCSINKGQDSVMGALGTVLSKAPGAAPDAAVVGSGSRLATSLTSDFSKADLGNLGTDVAELGASVNAPAGQNIDIAEVAKNASSVLNSLTPVADLLGSGAANPAATTSLAAAPAGTPDHAASQVLTNAAGSDLPGAISSISTLADTASKLVDSGKKTVSAGSTDAAALSTTTSTLGSQVAPLASTPTDVLGQASSVLSVLKPKVVVAQILNVATGITTINYQAILNDLTALPQKVAALDVAGAHLIAGDLNNQFAPLVKMAAGVDLKWISQILTLIPDPNGYTQLAALVCNILAGVDIVRIANNVGKIQEIAWSVLEGNPAALAGLLPIGLDLASAATGMLTGKATKTDTSQLGKDTAASSSANQITNQAQNMDLGGLTTSLTAMAGSQGAQDLATLVDQGLNAATFYASGSHAKYGELTVDNSGRNALQWLSDWFGIQIQRAA
jgi:hypothetical protein